MNYSAIEKMAMKAVSKAKPGIMKINGVFYSFCFNQQTWNYDVFEDGFLLLSYNTKTLSTAKKWLREYIAS